MNEKQLKIAHKHCSFHKEEIMESNVCGCFYCEKIFKPSDINEWHKEVRAKNPENRNKYTALCPHCGIDSVIGDKSGFTIDSSFLHEMKNYWFEGLSK